MDGKEYMLDNKPASARDLIEAAKELDDDYGRDGIFTTSGAAKVLRENGRSVGYNPDYKTSV